MSWIYSSFRTLVVLLGLLLCTQNGNGCGFTTHNLIAERARQWFFDANHVNMTSILNEHIDALQGGAPYPDYLYTCGSDHDAGEATHWPPFQAAAAKYIHDKYPEFWKDEQASKLVVFMLGVTSHYIADINWHGLAQVPFGQGFIRTMGSQNFNCSGNLCDTAHGKADSGGEFVAAYQFDLSFYRPEHWYVPVKDLVEIYKYAPEYVNKTVNSSSIEECSLLFQVGSWAIKTFGADIFSVEVANAPFLPEEYPEFYLGGVDDMAAWSSFMWNRMVNWVVHGPPNGTLPNDIKDKSLMMDGKSFTMPPPAQQDLLTAVKKVISHHSQSKSFTAQLPWSFEFDSRGGLNAKLSPSLMPEDFVVDLSDALLDVVLSHMPTDMIKSKALNRLVTHAKDQLKSRISSLYDPSNSTKSPHTSTVSSRFTSTAPLNGTRATEMFGSSLCSGDLNQDGYTDLVVGSPGFGIEGEAQVGRISIWLGTEGNPPFKEAGNITVSSRYARFGDSCGIIDMNLDGKLDIAIGAPSIKSQDIARAAGNYTGAIYVFYQNDDGAFASTPSVTMTTETTYASIGNSLKVVDDLTCVPDSKSVLMIGGPFLGSQDGHIHGGALMIMKPRTDLPEYIFLDTSSDLIMKGNEFSWFGHSSDLTCVDVSNDSTPILVVGSPGAESVHGTVGAITFFELSSNLTLPKKLFNMTHQADRSKFGNTVSFTRCGNNASETCVIVSAPSNGTHLVDIHKDQKVCEGGVEVFKFTTSSKNGTATLSLTILDSIQGTSDFERLGWTFQSVSDSKILISSPFKNHESGEVVLYDMNKQDSEVVFTGFMKNQRCGSTLSSNGTHAWISCPFANGPGSRNGQVYQINLE